MSEHKTDVLNSLLYHKGEYIRSWYCCKILYNCCKIRTL